MYLPTVADRVTGSGPIRRRQRVTRVLAHALSRLELHGLENVPAHGPLVFAMNHRDYVDGPLLFGFVPRPVSFLVKIEAFRPPVTGFLRSTGQVPVIRTHPDLRAVRLSLEILRAGGAIGIFPEGARGDGLVRTARPGMGYFAVRTGALVVPVAAHGTEELVQGLRRPSVRITIGKPLDLGRVPDGERVSRRRMLDATEQARAALAELVVATRPQAPLAKA
jgi:1-acyl-sn-glycerol-3-phosphate acyltransferase